jgi:DNA-binding ferritin-like protein (Dps family)
MRCNDSQVLAFSSCGDDVKKVENEVLQEEKEQWQHKWRGYG